MPQPAFASVAAVQCPILGEWRTSQVGAAVSAYDRRVISLW
jgi:hypothetical protein